MLHKANVVCYFGYVYCSSSCVAHLRQLVIVRFEAADEERLADGQSLHEGVQRLTELTTQRWHMFMVISLGLRGGIETLCQVSHTETNLSPMSFSMHVHYSSDT